MQILKLLKEVKKHKPEMAAEHGKNIFNQLFKFYSVAFGATLIPLIILCSIGYGLDIVFNTNKTFLIIGLVSSLPVSMFTTYVSMKKTFNNPKL